MPAVIQPWLQLPHCLCCQQPLPSDGAVSVQPEDEEEDEEEAVPLLLLPLEPLSSLQKPQVARQ